MLFKFLLVFLFSCSALATEQEILLSSGERHEIKTTEALWIENHKVLRAEEFAKGFFLVGRKPGQSQIRIGKSFKTVFVLDPDQHKTYRQLRDKIAETLNLSLHLENGQVQVQGRLLRLEDWLKLSDTCQNFLCKYQMAAEIPADLRATIQDYFQKKFAEKALPQQRLLFTNPISVQIVSGEYAKDLESFLTPYGIKILKMKTGIEIAPLIRVQITIAEIKKNETQKLGVSWPSSYTGQVLPRAAATGESVFASLNLLEQNGIGRVLASPNLLCRSGKSAEFVAGGEFPIKIMNYKLQDVVWKKYGIILKVKPEADFSGHMSISIETEVSSIDNSNKVDGIPGLFTNKVQSHFDISESRVIALSGLIKSEQSNDSQGLPGLGRIPILGALFASKDFRENRTELVIFVKPEIVNPSQTEN